MSREIKFRVWSEDQKTYEYKFPYNSIGDFYVSSHGKVFSDFGNTVAPEVRQEAFIVEQYTGLHDKNGKEIYEGDIVKCYSQDTYPAGRVLYSEEWCAYEIVSYDPEDCRVYNLESFSPTVNKYLEVIGNIHENPELLGGEE